MCGIFMMDQENTRTDLGIVTAPIALIDHLIVVNVNRRDLEIRINTCFRFFRVVADCRK